MDVPVDLYLVAMGVCSAVGAAAAVGFAVGELRGRTRGARADTRFRDALFDTLPNPVYVKGADGRLIDCNQAFAALCGLRRDDMVRDGGIPVETHDDALHTDVDGLLIEGLALSKSYEADVAVEGTVRHYVVTKKAVVGADGGVGIVAVMSDVTSRRRLEEELRTLAHTDALTEAMNRRHFMSVAATEFSRARRHGRPLAVAMLDIDHFKKINDGYGHETGDEALRVIAGVCHSTVRAEDYFGRLGGEEFAVLMPETDADGARALCERIRRSVSARTVRSHDGRDFKMTVSLGFSICAADDPDFEALLRRADAALYRAKEGGRDRVVQQDH